MKSIHAITIPSDNYEAYNKGRRDEMNAIISVIDLMRIQGFFDVALCNIMLDHIDRIDRRPRLGK